MENRFSSNRVFDVDIENWIDPVGRTGFMSSYWKSKLLYVAGHAERLAQLRTLLLDFDVRSLVYTAGSPIENCIRAWFLNKNKTDFRLTVQPKQANVLFDAGFTLYFEPKTPNMRDFHHKLERSLAYAPGRSACSIFVSKKGQLTTPHVDGNENFTIQLVGKKRWEVSGPGETTSEVIELSPGDLLYCPGQWLHAVETLDDSVSLNLSFFRYQWADFVEPYLKHFLSQLTPRMPEPSEGWASQNNRSFKEELAVYLSQVRDQWNDFTGDLCAPHLDLHEIRAGLNNRRHVVKSSLANIKVSHANSTVAVDVFGGNGPVCLDFSRDEIAACEPVLEDKGPTCLQDISARAQGVNIEPILSELLRLGAFRFVEPHS